MANPITFKPKSIDPKLELQRRLTAAPDQHAEALLVAYDLLEEAHRQGILDALHGAIGARDTIMGLIAKYAVEPVSVNALRNLLTLGKLLGTLEPDFISSLSKEISTAKEDIGRESEPPSLWQLFRRVRQTEARRGLSLLTSVLAALGRIRR